MRTGGGKQQMCQFFLEKPNFLKTSSLTLPKKPKNPLVPFPTRYKTLAFILVEYWISLPALFKTENHSPSDYIGIFSLIVPEKN